MKRLLVLALAFGVSAIAAQKSLAMTDDMADDSGFNVERPISGSTMSSPSDFSSTSTDNSDTSAGAITGRQPTVRLAPGNWNVNAGPSVPFGLTSNSALFGVGAGYTFAFNRELGLRVFGDGNFGDGANNARYIDTGAGVNYYLGQFIGQDAKRAFVTADAAIANARNSDTSDNKTGVGLGAGIGYNIAQTARTNIDVLVHYAVLLDQVDNNTPSVLTARLGVDF